MYTEERTYVPMLMVPEEFRHMTQIQGRMSVDGQMAIIHLQEPSHAHTILVNKTGWHILETCDNDVPDHSAFCPTETIYRQRLATLNMRVPVTDLLTLAVAHLCQTIHLFIPPDTPAPPDVLTEYTRTGQMLLANGEAAGDVITELHFGFGLDSAYDDIIDGQYCEDLHWRTWDVDENGEWLPAYAIDFDDDEL